MHSTRHDPDSAALRSSSSLPGHVFDVVVLTRDAGLLATLREASTAEQAIWSAAGADAAVDLLVGGRCNILVADIGALGVDAAGLLTRLQAQFPELILLATGRREEENAVAPLVTSGLIYRFLHKPVSPARAGLFLAAGTRRYQQMRNIEPIGLATVRTIASRPHSGKLVLVVAALLAGAVGIAIWQASDRDAPLEIGPPPASGPSAEQQLADALARAQIAFATGRLVEPRGDSALDFYRRALELQPGHPEARDGVARAIAAQEDRLQAALAARNAAAGAAALAALQRAYPQHPELDKLRDQLLTLSRSRRASPQSAAPRRAAPASQPADAPPDEEAERALQRALAQEEEQSAAPAPQQDAIIEAP